MIDKSTNPKFEGLIIPLRGTTSLELPYTVYDNGDLKIILKELSREDIKRSFRVSIIDGKKDKDGNQPWTYQIDDKGPLSFSFMEEGVFFLQETTLQLYATFENEGRGRDYFEEWSSPQT